eukprot:5448078-Karenia_brevis.AAC.1
MLLVAEATYGDVTRHTFLCLASASGHHHRFADSQQYSVCRVLEGDVRPPYAGVVLENKFE